MSIHRFPVVREDSDVVVYTEHPDHIHPRALSDECLIEYGENSFKIALLRNIYVIYVQRATTARGSNATEPRQGSVQTKALDVKLKDIKDAEKILRDARIPQMTQVKA